MTPAAPAGAPVVERRRLRTWEADASARPTEAWRIIARYGVVRAARSWWIVLPAVGALVATVIALGAATTEFRYGVYADHVSGLAAVAILQGAVFLFLVGTPLMAEDMRFHAPLFYFSKPLPVSQYLRGKAALLAGFLIVFTLVPLVLLLLVGAVTAAREPPSYVAEAQSTTWHATHLDSVGDWLFAAVVLVPGTVAVLAFLGAVTIAVSSYTRRAWHAAMGLVAIIGGWSLLGLVASDLVRNAYQHLFGPGGWAYLVLSAPLAVRYDDPGHTSPGLRGAGLAIPLAYLFLIGATMFCLWLARRRLEQQEALL